MKYLLIIFLSFFLSYPTCAQQTQTDENELGILSESDQDSLFNECLDIIRKEGKASTSLLQRKLSRNQTNLGIY